MTWRAEFVEEVPVTPTEGAEAMTRHDTITLYRAPDGWRWRYTTHTGRILADSGQGYSRRVDAVRGACRVAGTGEPYATFVLPDLRKHGVAFIRRVWCDVRFVIEGGAG